MAEPIAPVVESTLITAPPVVAPVAVAPEKVLFPETTPPVETVKPVEPEPVKPDVPPEPKKEEPKEPSKPSPEPKAAVDYESLKLPEGSLLSSDELAKVKKGAKESGLSLDEAKNVLDVKNDAVKTFFDSQKETLTRLRTEWKTAWSKDPEFGGDKLTESTELAKRAFDKLADSELKTLADQTGYGDNPAFLRMMARIGRLISEDQLIRGSVGGAPKPKSPEERLYGATTPGAEETIS